MIGPSRRLGRTSYRVCTSNDESETSEAWLIALAIAGSIPVRMILCNQLVEDSLVAADVVLGQCVGPVAFRVQVLEQEGVDRNHLAVMIAGGQVGMSDLPVERATDERY